MRHEVILVDEIRAPLMAPHFHASMRDSDKTPSLLSCWEGDHWSLSRRHQHPADSPSGDVLWAMGQTMGVQVSVMSNVRLVLRLLEGSLRQATGQAAAWPFLIRSPYLETRLCYGLCPPVKLAKKSLQPVACWDPYPLTNGGRLLQDVNDLFLRDEVARKQADMKLLKSGHLWVVAVWMRDCSGKGNQKKNPATLSQETG